jgi:hypothetical protein
VVMKPLTTHWDQGLKLKFYFYSDPIPDASVQDAVSHDPWGPNVLNHLWESSGQWLDITAYLFRKGDNSPISSPPLKVEFNSEYVIPEPVSVSLALIGVGSWVYCAAAKYCNELDLNS